MYCNFVRPHPTLKATPAVAAGLADHVWSIDELIAVMPEPKTEKRGPYRKQDSN
jgi:hypothetical protein